MKIERNHWHRLAMVGLVLAAFLSNRSFSQSINSAVEGQVSDSSGAAIAGADVVLINQATGTKETSKTNEAGRYLFPSVITGTYSLEAAKQGFESYHLSAFTLQVAQRATENIVLKPGSESSTVRVNAGNLAPLLDVGNNDLGTIITPQSVAQLPLNGRNFLQLAFLAGATQAGPDLSTSQTNRVLPGINVAGIQQDLTMYTVDGMALTGSRLGNSELNLSIADIDQFKVRQGFFLPGNGTDPAIIDVVTKSGSNHVHGELFEFLRTNQTQARNFFSPTPPGPYHRNQFGFGVGGPILKDKLFFFANYEGLRQILNAPVNGFTPSQAMFQGDFSELLPTTVIYDPSTFDPATGRRQPFPNNMIRPDRINPVAKNLLAYYLPGSSYASQPSNLFGNPKSYLNDDQYNIRIDYNPNASNVLFGHFADDNSPDGQDTLFPLGGSTFPMNTNLTVLQWTKIFSSSTVNEARVGWTRGQVFDRGASQTGIQDQIGITGTADVNGVPGIGLSGFTSFGNAAGNIGNIDNVYQAHDGVSRTLRSHAFQFGADLRYARSVQQSANGQARGVINFSNVFTAQLAPTASGQLGPVAGTGNSFADFLLGDPLNASVAAMPRMHYSFTQLEPYFHDSWKVRSGLTLNYGIGWYLGTPPSPLGSDKQYPHAFDFETGQVLFAALGKINPKVIDTDFNNFEPRVGLAWQPGHDANTVIRAGWGLYYGALRLVDQQFSILAPGVTLTQSLANSIFSPQPTYVFGNNVLPPIALQPITEEFAQNISGTLYALDTKNRTPYVEMWNLSIQHTFGPSNVVELDYLGNQAHRLGSRWNADDCSIPNSLRCDPSVRPYPQFNWILYSSNAGVSAYNALIAKFQHQYSHGLSLLANYTWSKTMSTLGGSSNVTGERATDHKADRGLAPFNVPQSLVVSAIWDIPFGRNRQFGSDLNPVLDGVVGGWGLDFITTFNQGNPFEITAPNTTLGTFTDFRADQLCNGREKLVNKNVRTNGGYWFNPSCFAAPPAGYFGNSQPGLITGPGQNNWDLAGHKNIRVREDVHLEFRTEFFNAFNHAQFLQPNNSVASPSLGKISTARDGRILQFGLKLLW